MLKIGEFSRLARVTVKALRYYDELGLIKPAQMDEWSGYRYYALDQLPRLNRILALKDLGLALEQIGQLLDKGMSREHLEGILLGKQSELQQRMRDDQLLLAKVEARLRQLAEEEQMSDAEVVVKEVAPITIASVRATIPGYASIGSLYGELFAHLGRSGGWPTGPCMALWHDTEYKEADVDGEAAVPIGGAIPEGGRVKVYELPAATVASTVHNGSYARLGDAYTALLTWIERNGYRVTAPNREIYLYAGNGNDVRQDDESYVTEIQFPVDRSNA
jgi:effector-binding domain-containing protein